MIRGTTKKKNYIYFKKGNMRKLLLIFTLCAFTQMQFSYCQEIEDYDTVEIKARAKDCISSFELLLNEIADPDTRKITISEMIRGSFGLGDGFLHIFADSSVIIEDDLHPNAYASTYLKDVKVAKYLSDFDLLYSKSYRKSVFFSDIEVSDVQTSEKYIYVLVSYLSTFSGNHRMIDTPYKPLERLATVRADFDNIYRKWDVRIVGIQFVHRPTIPIEALETDTTIILPPSTVPVDETVAVEEDIAPAQETLSISFQDIPVSIKRGKTVDIKWTESQEQNSRNLLLYLDGIKVNTLKENITTNQYQWIIPDEQSPGKNYQLGLTLNDSDDIYFSQSFKIKRKIPLGVKVFVPAAVTGAIIYIICCTGDQDPELPDPPVIQ